MAVVDSAEKEDLIGVHTWNLMRINKNGVIFLRNGVEGNSGMMAEEHTFFNPVWSAIAGNHEARLEETLSNIVASQY